jgi:hypothetical protein
MTTARLEDLVSREDGAVLADCSIDTIKRDIKLHGLHTEPGPRGKVMVRVADLVRIGRIKPDVLGDGVSGSTTAELRRTQEQVRQLLAGAARDAGRLEERTALVEVLRQQIAAKDRQITQLNGTVERLLAKLQTGRAA